MGVQDQGTEDIAARSQVSYWRNIILRLRTLLYVPMPNSDSKLPQIYPVVTFGTPRSDVRACRAQSRGEFEYG